MDAARRWPQSGAHPPPRRESGPPGAGPQRAPRPERDREFPLRHRSGDRGLCQPAARIGCVAATARANRTPWMRRKQAPGAFCDLCGRKAKATQALFPPS